jgi:hypothetical protein
MTRPCRPACPSRKTSSCLARYHITLDGQVIWGVGVSGGHYRQDQQCGEAGLAAIGAS